jgi:two-component sensor histidine kinase
VGQIARIREKARAGSYRYVVFCTAAILFALAAFMFASFLDSRRSALAQAEKSLLYSATLIGESVEGKLGMARAVFEPLAKVPRGALGPSALLDAANQLSEADNVYLLDSEGRVLASAYPRREPRLLLGPRGLEGLREGAKSSALIAEAPEEGGRALVFLRARGGAGGFEGALAAVFLGSLMEERLGALAEGSIAAMEIRDGEGSALRLFGDRNGIKGAEASFKVRTFPLQVVAASDKASGLAGTRRQGISFLVLFAASLLLCSGLAAYGAVLHGRAKRAAVLDKELAAKDVLFHEVNHRVKNNLAIVASILGLGAQELGEAGKDPAAVFESAIDRVHSIALLHERLYRNASLASADFGAYAADLAESLREAYGQGRGIELRVSSDPGVEVGLNEAVPLGLIVSELVTNAYKYAFAGREGGEISVEVRASGKKGGLELSVVDDGVGFDPKAAGRAGFGLVLVESLAAQIGAGARCERAEPRGTRWLVSMGPRS